jgi:putative transposase
MERRGWWPPWSRSSPQALRQRCLAHKTRNVLAKVSAQHQAQVKADIQSAYYASSQEVACLVAAQVVEKWQKVCPSAMASFQEDFEACIAYLRCPANHHKYIRTTNLAERSIEEERRRSKVIPRFFDEKSALNLCFARISTARRRRPPTTHYADRHAGRRWPEP